MQLDKKTKMIYFAMASMIGVNGVNALAGATERLRDGGFSGEEITDLIASTGKVKYKNGKPVSVDLSRFGTASLVYDNELDKNEFISTLKKQVKEGYNPGEDYMDVPEERKTPLIVSGGLVGLIAASVFGAVQHFSAPPLYATPIMIVDYDNHNTFSEYLVTNISPQNPDYDMKEFVLPAGSNQGVYDAIGPDDWAFDINLDETVFNTVVPGARIKPDGGDGVFELYYNPVEDFIQRNAIAYTRFEEPFNSVSVGVPIPEPITIAILGAGLAGLFTLNYKREKK